MRWIKLECENKLYIHFDFFVGVEREGWER